MRFPIPASLAAASCLLLAASCGERPTVAGTQSSGGKTVLATFYPTQYFAQRIAGNHLEVGCPLPAGADPIFWRPDGPAIQRYQAADLIIINGADLEKWIGTVSLPESRLVNTTKSFEQDFITFEVSTTHRHGKDGEEHAHGGTDGHTWLDPNNAKVQAASIHQALAKRWPAHAAEFETNFQELVTDLDALDRSLKEIDPDRPLLASHPVYNYLARRYGWQVTNLHLDPDTMPPKDAIPADHPAKILLWESPPREKAIAVLEKNHGVKSIVFSPAAQQGEQDYLATMKANIARLKQALD